MSEEKNEVVKKPRGHKSSPVIGDNGLQTLPGDNAKYLKVSLELANLPKVDLHNPEEVLNQVNKYFEIHADHDLKPTVAGLGMVLGLDNRRLWEIKVGAPMGGTAQWKLPTETLETIKKAYRILENLWENYMNNGKINPVSGIFLGKNNFGYRDQTEYVVTPNTPSDNDYNIEDIKKRYAIDSATVPTIDYNDSESDS